MAKWLDTSHGRITRVARVITLLVTALLTVSTGASHSFESSPVPWKLPLQGISLADITNDFQPPVSTFGKGHRGIDFPAPIGATVRAIGDGLVTFQGRIAGKPVIVINHGVHPYIHKEQIRSTYEPVDSAVSMGSFVRAGDSIGVVSGVGESLGHCSHSCLHLGIKINRHLYVNPKLLWSRIVVLSPLRSAGELTQKKFGVDQR